MFYKQVDKGATDVEVPLKIVDSGDGTPETGVVFNTSGIDLWYRRDGAAKVSITEATLAALDTAHTDGGFLHISDGVYRLDVPDAAFATGVRSVQIGGTVTGMVVIGCYVDLMDPFNLTGTGLTAIPWNAAWDAEVQSEAADALNAYDPPTKAELDSAVSPLATAASVALLQTYPKNVAVSKFGLAMYLTDGTLATGVTITGTISKDGGDFAALGDAVTEIQTSGCYEVDIAQAEMNADEILLKFTGTGCRPLVIKIRTQA